MQIGKLLYKIIINENIDQVTCYTKFLFKIENLDNNEDEHDSQVG